MKDIIVVAVILVVVGCAALYVYKTRKSGRACIGCPDSKQCSGCSGCAMSATCCNNQNEKEQG